jgi:hypothetical protein
MLDRNQWPEALRDFLIGRQHVAVEDVAYGAIRCAGGYHPDESAVTWIRQALTALRWRQGKGLTWRKPAKA